MKVKKSIAYFTVNLSNEWRVPSESNHYSDDLKGKAGKCNENMK